MAYPRYQRYKPTADAWLGDVPAHWIVTSLRRYFMVKSGDMISALDMEDDGYPVFGGNGFRGRYANWNTEPDTLIIGRYGALCGNARVTTERIWATEHAFRAIPILPYSPRFFCYLVEAIDLNKFSARSAQPGLNSELVRANACAVPPLDEQDIIAEFLDRETARIDALIAKKRRLLELLEEKRLAVITHAVTKGLDPNAPMKDSGFMWIGQMPTHWDASHTRFVARLYTGHTPSRLIPEYWDDCTIPWFTLNDVWQLRDGVQYVSETAEKISELGLANSSARLLPADTVILSRTASVGFAGILARPMATTQDFVNWVCGSRLLPKYLYYVFRGMTKEFQRVMRGSTHQTIYMPVVQKFSTPLPPIAEQRAIIAYLDGEGARIERMTVANRRFIALLQEYRSALITNAVTGKIDVRGDAEKEAAA